MVWNSIFYHMLNSSKYLNLFVEFQFRSFILYFCSYGELFVHVIYREFIEHYSVLGLLLGVGNQPGMIPGLTDLMFLWVRPLPLHCVLIDYASIWDLFKKYIYSRPLNSARVKGADSKNPPIVSLGVSISQVPHQQTQSATDHVVL